MEKLIMKVSRGKKMREKKRENLSGEDKIDRKSRR
jgi:hypothetical protein